MPTPLPKSKQISDKLVDILESDVQISEWEFRGYLRDIKALRDFDEEAYLLALAYASYGDYKQAVLYFEDSLHTDYDGVAASNYIAYVTNHGTWPEKAKLSARLADKYESSLDFNGAAHYCHLYCGDFGGAITYGLRYAKLALNEGGDTMKDNIANLESNLRIFKEHSRLSDSQVSIVTSSMATVMDKNKLSPRNVVFQRVSEETLNAYIIQLNSTSSKQVAAMNMELAYQFAEHDELLGHNFNAWFESCSNDEAEPEKKNACN